MTKEQRDLMIATGAFLALYTKSCGGEWIEAKNPDHRLLMDLSGLGDKMDYAACGERLADLVCAVASGK